MKLEHVIGPATIIYLVSATTAALWWASDLTRRVNTIEASTVTAERIATLESEVSALAQNTRELRASVNELVRELRNAR